MGIWLLEQQLLNLFGNSLLNEEDAFSSIKANAKTANFIFVKHLWDTTLAL